MKNIKCNSIDYRKGFIEVANIHDGCVNLEAWEVQAEIDISDLRMEDLPEDSVVADVEIELSLENAEELIRQLQLAIEEAGDSDR